jgi:hypothetical protein
LTSDDGLATVAGIPRQNPNVSKASKPSLSFVITTSPGARSATRASASSTRWAALATHSNKSRSRSAGELLRYERRIRSASRSEAIRNRNLAGRIQAFLAATEADR